MKYKIIIIGSSGQLGWELTRYLAADPNIQVVPLCRKLLDITDAQAVNKLISDIRPSLVINTAAYTQVDDCETNREAAFLINQCGAANVAAAANEINAKLIHISTDYVFDGKKGMPYAEADAALPINAYGASKRAGELKVQKRCRRHFIVRTSWLYGANGHNFVKTMLKLARKQESISVVNDQRGTPTWTFNLAKQLKKLFPTTHYGIVHASCQGDCTWYGFAKEIFKQSRLDVDLRAVLTEEYFQPAERPAYSVLDNARLRELNIDVMQTWEEALRSYLKSTTKMNLEKEEVH